MATNYVRLIVRIVNPPDVVIITNNYPYTSEKERISIGKNTATKMFATGLFEEMSSSEVLAIPPHRIEDITIESH
ncbi:hypothetical protein LCGC14_0574240 [marine sediment metagenome]|uniref:Uncharacterized protein n=1 Tax=marine sediment metagenome TaxID=412755 RepID=A0A0F9RNK6_9ZZZZ